MTNDEHHEHLLDRLKTAGGFESYLITLGYVLTERTLEESKRHSLTITAYLLALRLQ